MNEWINKHKWITGIYHLYYMNQRKILKYFEGCFKCCWVFFLLESSLRTLHDTWMFAFHLLFSYSSCAVPTVKMESGYIYSMFIRARHSGLAECLSYWHTCCFSNGSAETQWQGFMQLLSVSICPWAVNSATCWLYSVEFLNMLNF